MRLIQIVSPPTPNPTPIPTPFPTLPPSPAGTCLLEFQHCTNDMTNCCNGLTCTQVDAGGCFKCLQDRTPTCNPQWSPCDPSLENECCEGYSCTQVDANGCGYCLASQCGAGGTPSPSPPAPTPPVSACEGKYWADFATNSCKCDCPLGAGVGCKPMPPPIPYYGSIDSCCSMGLSWIDPKYCNSRSIDEYSNGWVVDWLSETCGKLFYS